MGGPALLVIDTPPRAQHTAETILNQAIDLLASLESRFSRYRPESLITQINQRSGTGHYTDLDTEAEALFELAGQLWTESEGLFDITSGPLRHAWDFRSGGKAAPDNIGQALELVGYGHIEWLGNSCHLPQAGMEVDLGGIVKEYAVDRTTAFLRNTGVTSGLVELAGDVAVIGSQGDETPWSIGIQDPNGPGLLCSVSLVDAALATSGNYARTLTHDEKKYGHLLDPRSGWPVSGPDSVSVIDAHCLAAGAVATVACLKHEGAAIDWLRDSQLPWLLCNAGERPVGPIAETLSSMVGGIE